MRLEQLRLHGITKFDKPVAIDFSMFPAGALVAIVGSNGEGKTTILDSSLAALYREMPSRMGYSLFDFATVRDAYIDETFVMDKVRYRARVSLDGVGRKGDALLQRELDGQWVNLNDGKVSTFTGAVESRFPPLAVVLASAFAAQNRAGSFLTLDRTGRKDLFSALLGLAHYDAMAATCRAEVQRLDRRRGELEAVVAQIQANLSPETERQLIETEASLVAHHCELKDQVAALDKAWPHIETALSFESAALEAAREASAALRATKVRQVSLEQERVRLVNEIKAVSQAYLGQKTVINARRHADKVRTQAEIDGLPSESTLTERMEKEVRSIERLLEDDIETINLSIENNRTELLGKATEIRAAAQEHMDLSAAIEIHRATIASVRAKVEQSRNSERELSDKRARDGACVERLQAARAAAALLKSVPCGGVGVYASCELLASAKSAEASIHELEGEVIDLDNLSDSIRLIHNAIDLANESIRYSEEKMTACQRDRSKLDTLAQRLPMLVVAEDRIKELEKQIETKRAGADTLIGLEKKRYLEISTQAAETRDKLTVALQDIDKRADEDTTNAGVESRNAAARFETRLVEVGNELAEADTAVTLAGDVKATLEQAEATYLRTKAQKDEHALSVERVNGELATFNAEWRNFERLKAIHEKQAQDLAGAEAELAPILTDVTEYGVLAQCFGREGLPVLEIDAAGPAVSALCNDLLQSCFGSSRFTVELVTEQAKASGKGTKEVFELKVYDSEAGGATRDVALLSGGEQVIVDEALKSAIAIYVNQHNQTPFETCWRDETTGALDPENALRYVNLLRRLQQRGAFHHVIFISHNPEVYNQADVQLVVKDGTVTPRFAPFGG